MKRIADLFLNIATVLALTAIGYTGLRPGGFIRTAWEERLDASRLAALRVSLWDSLSNTPATLGSPGSAVAAVEFADYECPFCRQISPTVDSVTGATHLAVAFRHLPIATHPLARPAALAAICATEQARFPAMHARLMHTTQWRTDSNWVREARAAGVPDIPAFEACLTSSRAAQKLVADIDFAKRLEVGGTPTFITPRRQWANAAFAADSLR